MAGVIMSRGGISKRLFNFFAYFIGKATGGLPSTTVATCLFYGAISGSGPATTAAVGKMSVPYLTDNGYNKEFSVALVAVAGGLGVIIPPSVPFIMYATATTTVSVGGMFIAGVLPGIFIGACLMVYCYIHCKRKGEDKEKLVEAYNKMHEAGFLNILKGKHTFPADARYYSGRYLWGNYDADGGCRDIGSVCFDIEYVCL